MQAKKAMAERVLLGLAHLRSAGGQAPSSLYNCLFKVLYPGQDIK